MTQDNVLDLFDEISRSDDIESHRQQYSALVQLYRDLPKDMFLSRILSDYNADEKLLYELRSNLFAELKSIEKCPFVPGTELKRRKNTTRGEGVHVKLCGDIYILTSVLDGAPFDDLKDLISISKYSSQNENDQSVLIDANTPLVGKNLPQNSDFDLTILRSSIATVQADIIALKQDNNTLNDELKSIKNELISFKSETEAALNKIKSTVAECEQSIVRIGDDKRQKQRNCEYQK